MEKLIEKVRRKYGDANIEITSGFPPELLGEYGYIVTIENEEGLLAEVSGFTVDDIVIALEELVNE